VVEYRVSYAFIYALTLTLAAFASRNAIWLLTATAISSALALWEAGKRFLYLLALVAFGSVGVFINAVAFANSGNVVFEVGPLQIRSGAVEAFTVATLRLALIASAGGVFVFSGSPSEIVRGLRTELGLPAEISIAVSYALRLLPLLRRDLDEILFMRRQRGYRTIPMSPSDVETLLSPLLSVSVERATWSGVASELRGFRHLRRGFDLRPRGGDYLILALLMALMTLFFVA